VKQQKLKKENESQNRLVGLPVDLDEPSSSTQSSELDLGLPDEEQIPVTSSSNSPQSEPVSASEKKKFW